MESKKGYYIDIQNGTVRTFEEMQEVQTVEIKSAIEELEHLKALMNEYNWRFGNYKVCDASEKLAHEIAMREQNIDFVLEVLKKGGSNNDY